MAYPYSAATAIAICALTAATRIRLNNGSQMIGAVTKRLREEFGKLQVEINDEKSRQLTLNGASASVFWVSNFRYLRSLRGAMRPHDTPGLKKRTALMRELKEAFILAVVSDDPIPASTRRFKAMTP